MEWSTKQHTHLKTCSTNPPEILDPIKYRYLLRQILLPHSLKSSQNGASLTTVNVRKTRGRVQQETPTHSYLPALL